MEGAARQERGSMTREAEVHQARGGAPFLDAFLAEWMVISMERGDKRGARRSATREGWLDLMTQQFHTTMTTTIMTMTTSFYYCRAGKIVLKKTMLRG